MLGDEWNLLGFCSLNVYVTPNQTIKNNFRTILLHLNFGENKFIQMARMKRRIIQGMQIGEETEKRGRGTERGKQKVRK
jgi:hypothetical protein